MNAIPNRNQGLAVNSGSMRNLYSAILNLTFLALWLLAPQQACAEVLSWRGGIDGYWRTPGNWSTGTAPQDGDELVFSAASARLATTNNLVPAPRLRSITIDRANYALRGNPVIVTGGIAAHYDAGASASIELDITLMRILTPGDVYEIRCSTDNSILYVTGDIALLGSTPIAVGGSGNVLLGGAISGTGGITKIGTGSLRFYGSTANTYTGITRVVVGRLELNKTGVDAMAGDLYVGDSLGADTVRWLRGDQLPDTTTVTVYADGLLDLNNFDETIGELILRAGQVETGSGTLTLNGNVTAGDVDGLATIRGNLALGAATRTFEVIPEPDHGSYPQLRVHAAISGTGGLTKTGAGYLSLAGSNTYRGLTTVDSGTLILESDAALGDTIRGTVVQSGGALYLGNAVQVGDESLTVSGSGHPGASALMDFGGATNSWAGSVTLMNPVGVYVSSGSRLILTGPIGGAGGPILMGPGTLMFSGSSGNTYTGDTVVNQGTLLLAKSDADGAIPGPLAIGNDEGGAGADVVRLERANQIANTAGVTISSSGRFDLNGYFDRIDAVTGNGSITLDSGHLIAGHSGSSFTFGGRVSGTGYLWKVGGGTWTLTANNTYSGTTWIEAGTLLVNGSQPASDVEIQSRGVLGGTGSVGRLTSTGGALSPGVSPGTLTSSNVFLDAASDFVVELTGAGADQLNARGKVALGNASLVLSAAGLLPTEGQQFVILSNDGTDAITGTFAGLREGAYVSAGPCQFRVTYAGGTGNDVVLIATNTAALRPVLSIWRTATNTVVLSWPQSDIAWLLHATTNLGATPSLWMEIPPPYSSNLTDYLLTEPAPVGSKFYRLHRP